MDSKQIPQDSLSLNGKFLPDRQRNIGHGLFQWLLGLVLAVLIIAIAATVGLNLRAVYSADIDRYHLTEVSGLSKERLEENFRVLVDYNNIWGAKELEFPDFVMSEHGRIHFAEVKDIFGALQWAGLAAAAILVVYLIAVRLRRRDGMIEIEDYRFLKYGSALVIIVPAVLGGAIALNWERAFVVFHELLFDNDYWIFDEATDPVITVLPDHFFMHVALVMIATAVVCSAVCMILYLILKKRQPESKPVMAEEEELQ